MVLLFLCLAACLAAPAAAFADETSITLKPGEGADLVADSCGACHSLDYIPMNAPFPTPKVWDAEVTKMIKVFGADIDDADAKAIVAYLSKAYGS